MSVHKIKLKYFELCGNCYDVMQGECVLTNATNKQYMLSTYGLGPCHSLIMYNKENKRGMLSHIDIFCDVSILDYVIWLLDIKNKNNLEIHIVSGYGCKTIYNKIFNVLTSNNLMSRIIKEDIAEHTYTASLDTRTGVVAYSWCDNWEEKKNYQPHNFDKPLILTNLLKKMNI